MKGWNWPCNNSDFLFSFFCFFFFLLVNRCLIFGSCWWMVRSVWLIAATVAFNIHKSCSWRLRQAHHFCLKLIVTKQARHPGHQFRCLIGGSSGGRNRGEKIKLFFFVLSVRMSRLSKEQVDDRASLSIKLYPPLTADVCSGLFVRGINWQNPQHLKQLGPGSVLRTQQQFPSFSVKRHLQYNKQWEVCFPCEVL